jgi:uncharacterized protein (DUF362 family)
MVDRVFRLTVGEIKDIVRPSSRVVIKPNVTGPRPPEEVSTTDPRIIQALCTLFKKAQPTAYINVVDNPSLAHSGTKGLRAEEAFRVSSILEAANAGGADHISLQIDRRGHENSKTEIVRLKEPFVIEEVEVFRSILEADLIVNIPKMKTIVDELVSLGLKNLQGIVPTSELVTYTNQVHMGKQSKLGGLQQAYHRADNPLKILDLYKALVQRQRRMITLIDGLWAMEGQGPWMGQPVKMDLIIGGEDPVAVDATGARCMGIEPSEVNLLRCAHTFGLGSIDEKDIQVLGDSLAAVRRIFRRPCWNPVGVLRSVHVLVGGACIGCLAHIRGALDYVIKESTRGGCLLDTLDDVYVIAGVDVSEVALRQIQGKEGQVYLVGDCCDLKNVDGGPSVRERVEKYVSNYEYSKGCAPVMTIIHLGEWILRSPKKS